MEQRIIDVLITYLSAYGYYIVFAALLLENFFITGLVIPGETVLLIAAGFAGQGSLNIVYVMLTAMMAAILGNIAGYFIGERGGRPLIEKFGGQFISPERITAAEEYFDVHGPKTVFIGRFAAGVRVFVPLLAGASRMNFAKFIAYTTAAVITWTIGLGLIGFFFGENWQLVKELLGRFGVAILAIVVAFIAFYVVRRRRERALNRSDDSAGA
ncbi:MAG TPA: DedA family protein [Candidatus Aquicultor sp.]|jgi:membrane protein DedA with SNARE-associated domain